MKKICNNKRVLKFSYYFFILGVSFINGYQVRGSETKHYEIQPRIITGEITDTNGLPIPGANIIIKNTSTGVVSDMDGMYSIEINSNEAVLVFSFLGFNAKEIPVGDRNVVNVVLEENESKLDEVVVVSYGSQLKRNITGSVATVDVTELPDMPVSQITQKLQGQLAGVQITQQTGRPGSGMSVRIRGQVSILANSEPLYVVDGFPITGDISNINPSEIETISVLKDASASALYGSRAANGVVLITTKGAKLGQSNFNVNAYYGVQQVPQRGRPDMMNAREFAQFKKESYEAREQAVPTVFQNPEQYGEGTDWYDAMLRDAPIQEYSLNYSTRDEKHSVSVTGGYLNQEGVVLNSGYERFSIRANTTYNITDWLTTGINVAPSYTNEDIVVTDGWFGRGSAIMGALQAWPIIPIRDEDGNLTPTAFIPGVSAFSAPNWVYTIKNLTRNNKAYRLLSNAFVEAEVIDGLKLRTTINAKLGQSNYKQFYPSHISTSWSQVPPTTAIAQYNNDNHYSWLNENIATYTKSLGENNFELLAGLSIQKSRTEGTNLRASEFPDDRIPTVQSAINIVRSSTGNTIQEWALLSYFSRINYNYAGKYLLSGSLRSDGSSRFGSNNKWGVFPSISAGWILSDEKFMENINPISFLKLRASYGVTGNNNIGNYTHLANVNLTANTIFGSSVASGATLSDIGNSNLGWERTAQTDIGLEVGFLKNRIQLTYDYYSKMTSDLLFNIEVPRASGFNSITSNAGDIRFWGHEIGITSHNLNNNSNLKWNTKFNLAFSDNRVEKLTGLTDRLMSTGERINTITQVGGKVGQFYGFVWDGVYDNQEEFDNSPKHIRSGVGTIKFRDINGDGVITPEGDQTVIGDPFPDFIFGITNNFEYKNLGLAIIMSGSVGNDVARMSDGATTNLDGVFNVLREVQYRWRSEEDPGRGRYGRTDADTGLERGSTSSRFIHDASHLTINNVTLSYNLPLSTNNVFQSVRLYSSIQRLYIFTGYDGGNPEVSTDVNGDSPTALTLGQDYSVYPAPRTISFGVNLSLR